MMILVMECSTASAKAMLFDAKNNTVVKSLSEPYPYKVCHVGGETGVHDADMVCRQTIAMGRALIEQMEASASIEAVSLGGTFHSILVCDTNFTPVTPTYTWEYGGAKNTAADLRKSRDYALGVYRRTGCMVHALYSAVQLRHLQRERGVRLDNRLLASQSAYLFFKLTAEHRESACTGSGSGMLNIHTRDWDADVLSEIGIKQTQLGRAVNYRETAPLSSGGASLLGLKSGIPVIPAHPDGALNQVGSGALVEGVMTFSVGTSGALRLSTAKPLVPDTPSTWCYLSPDAWMSGAATSGACNCVDWIKPVLFPNQSYTEVESCLPDYRTMPYFLPFLFGERCPGWQDGKPGGFYGMLAGHTPHDLYFSVLEGVLFNLYQCYQALLSVAGTPKTIQLSGGILNSPAWCQMCADIFGKDMVCAKASQASMVGAAVLGMAVTGQIAHIEDYHVDSQEVVHPNPAFHDMFEKRFAEYRRLYESF